jgi:multidrug resistance efflux pump
MFRRLRRWLLPALATGLLVFAVLHVVKDQQQVPKAKPPVDPPRAPFRDAVAGAGIVEAKTENISIGSHLPGIVAEVLVEAGQSVEKGTPLFRLDDRALKASLRVMQANVLAAKADLSRLESMPRPEELPAAEAKILEAKATVSEKKAHYDRARKLDAENASTEQELVTRKQAYETSQQQLVAAKAEFDLLKAGAWGPEKDVAKAKVEQNIASVEQVQTDIDRLVVCAPVEGEVLQVNVRPGEYVSTMSGQALVVLGNVHVLHVRVDIDENDIPRFQRGAQAVATLRGDPKTKFDLQFERVEPFVVPKKSLTGDNTERVDTRVLQVIYSIGNEACNLYVGQQVDVFIDAAKSAVSSSERATGGKM